MFHLRRIGPGVAAAAMVLTAAPLAPAPSAAQTAQVLSPGQVQALDQPGVPMRAFSDGRVNTYGVGIDVTGVSFSTFAGVGSEAVTAAPGSLLVVLHIVSQFDPDSWDDDTNADKGLFQAVVTSGSVTDNLFPNGVTGGNLDNYVVAAIPDDNNPPVLTVSTGGLLPQSINLSSGKRVGTSPQILYRDPRIPVVDINPTATESFSGTTDAGQQATAQFGIKEAMLSYWQPYTTTFAPSPDQAYLVLFMDLSNLAVIGVNLYAPAVPASDVAVTLPDGETPQVHYSPDPGGLNDLFSDGYYWVQVPADVASAKVTFNLPAVSPVDATSSSMDGSQSAKITFASPVSAELTIPPAWTPPAPTTGQQFSVAPQPPKVGEKSGSFPWIVLVIPLLAIALAGALLFARRRRAWLPARELAWPPKALPPATTALLTRAPPLALPPGPAAIGPAPNGHTPTTGEPVPPVRPSLFIRVAGPLEVDGLRRRIRRNAVRRFLVCLALSPGRPLSTEEIAIGISDKPDRDPQRGSVYSFASILRASAPEGVLPDAGPGGGYRFDPDAVVVDWTAIATVASETDTQPGWTDRAIAALELVRGQPLVGGLWEGIIPAVRAMQSTIDDLAQRLCARLIAAGDPAAAEHAVAKGLLAIDKSVGLWGSRLDAAAAGSGYGFERAWADAQEALGPDAALLFPKYQTLRRQLGEQPAPTPD